MGNCLSSQDADDISLIRENDLSDNRSTSRTDRRPRPTTSNRLSHNRGTESLHPVEPPPPYQEAPVITIYHPSPSISRPANQLTEEEQIQIAQRLGLIHHLPLGVYDGTSKKAKECVICMVEFSLGDMLRFLPCMHVYHKDCIDDWLMRSFTCPSCMEPVDAALLSTYQTS